MKFDVIYNNARSLKIIPQGPIETIDEEGVIEMIRFDGEDVISIGDKVPVLIKNGNREVNTYFIVNNILNRGNLILLSEFPITPAQDLLLPLLKLSANDVLANHDLCGVYSYYKESKYSTREDAIFLIYRWNAFEYYSKFIYELTSNPLCLEKLSSKDGRFEILTFEIPPIFKHDATLIHKSEYLDLSAFAKKTIITFNNDNFITNTIGNNPKYREYMEKELGAAIPEKISLYHKFKVSTVTYEE